MRDQDNQRRLRREYYYRNKDTHIARNKAKVLELKEYVAQVKDVPCTDCGVSYPPYVMDFDHLPEHNKTGNISRMIADGSLSKIKEEIKKCEIVCSNCHRVRTFNRSQV